MSLQSYLKPTRDEPSNNIYYYYCICMRCMSSSRGKWASHVVALVTPLLLCYHQGDWTQGPRLAWRVPLSEDPPPWPRYEILYGINVYCNNGMSALCNWLYSDWIRLKLPTVEGSPGTFQYSKDWQKYGKLKVTQWSRGYLSGCGEVSHPPSPSLALVTVLHS